MFGSSRPRLPNNVQWNGYRAPHNPQRIPYHGPVPRAPFMPRSQGFHNHRPQAHNQNPDSNFNQEHWCETCDRGFPNEQLLNNHKQQHQTCNIDGCQFVAHPKVITKHIQMQHSSGLFKKISKLNNPEEIEKWREERRKKYPTKVNIDKKAAELKEKIDRGEKMGLGRKEWVKKNNVSEQGQKRSYNNNNNPETKPRKPNRRNLAKRPKVLPTPEDNRSLIPFPGIQTLTMDSDEEEEENEDVRCHNLIEDDDIDNSVVAIQEDKTNVVKAVVCGALSSLMCEYGSSDDDNDGIDQQIKKKIDIPPPGQERYKSPNINLLKVDVDSTKVVQNLPKMIKAFNHEELKDEQVPSKQHNPEKPDDNKNSSVDSDNNKLSSSIQVDANLVNNTENGDIDSGPEEIMVGKKDDIANIGDGNTKAIKRKVEFVKRKPIFRKPKPKIPSTLIYKLLSKEMKQERNKVLQCVRYIVKHNYFAKT